jgi:hypothetical protein
LSGNKPHSAKPAGVIIITRAVDTIIQAVSPEFKFSEATADEKGIAHRVVATARHLIFKIYSPYLILLFK